jgi:hypothetical protein
MRGKMPVNEFTDEELVPIGVLCHLSRQHQTFVGSPYLCDMCNAPLDGKRIRVRDNLAMCNDCHAENVRLNPSIQRASIRKEDTMSRLDEVAAVVFVRGLEPETVAAMKTLLLTKAAQQQERPDPETRLGLAFIAFTTAGMDEPTEMEIEQVLERVSPLWTKSEVERLEKLAAEEPPA